MRGRSGATRPGADPARPLYLLMVYAKAMREDMTQEAKKAVAEFAAPIKRAARG